MRPGSGATSGTVRTTILASGFTPVQAVVAVRTPPNSRRAFGAVPSRGPYLGPGLLALLGPETRFTNTPSAMAAENAPTTNSAPRAPSAE